MTALTARPSAEPNDATEAARLNSIGVALMNQQLTEKAAAQFAAAEKADPQSAIPVLNRGIALLYLEKLPEAEQELQQAARMAPDNPRVWYNLGLTQMDEANQKGAIEDMRRVLAIDPQDADAHYFVAQLDLTLGNFNDAIAEFEKALELNPIHCSAQFGLARALQRVGRTQEAHEHLKIFQHLTQAKIASPLSVGYGERGHYSTMEEMELPEAPVGAMIPVRFEPQRVMQFAPSHYRQDAGAAADGSLGGGACIADLEG
ncbi:MAG: tetratricopeptide repeat protein, partial [Acidobacteriaceae bacterium]